ncbi:anaerobic ribonucleoside-triphosphate reductase activating protein [Shewanella sp. CG12_big_fil_rev_8_21_14_0_65_47_15]|uniref:anaerobic ribonucleoside-triphosphate reductase activating protein n=1 Tax=Shewanella sp. CG12_big_fil_rev_8_21_14_0_65_47_15 TaxID=1975537 RepID=UPI000CB31554|nr:anaerobic ribonucleoside-triphosphate reductase activating protein [Shewanella sp. CG12_big_fil_rev_8_21_14_0_65_47_15]PIW60540.1 MAG: anaerobic ribonucleoside-triphosphate reductase activating protein [Shewanella sp. CG12_big_fil_rev_8_21_14_0_65_47_15]
MGNLAFNSFQPQICFQEVPDEVSLAFTITGCPLRCQGCHSQDSWDPRIGIALNKLMFEGYLDRYQGLVSCILFFGGEWNPEALIEKLLIAKTMGLKTCLYTGKEKVPQKIVRQLDYLKTGAWQPTRGGLEKSTTNQRFTELKTGNLLNFKFREQ